MEMCETKYFGDRLVKAVEEGKVPMERIDDAAVRIVRTLLAFTEADPKEGPGRRSRMQRTYQSGTEMCPGGITLIQNKEKGTAVSRGRDKDNCSYRKTG